MLRSHITDDQQSVTEKEMENRIRVADELQAILLVNQGKKIPRDLKERLIDKQKKEFDKKEDRR